MSARWSRRGVVWTTLTVSALLGTLAAQAWGKSPQAWKPGTISFARAMQDQQGGERQVIEAPGAPSPVPISERSGFSDSKAMEALPEARRSSNENSPTPESSWGGMTYYEGSPGGISNWFDNSYLFSSFDSFTGPLDLGSGRGNFGNRYGAYLALPLAPCYGLGVEGGGSAGWYDYKGTQFTGSRTRFQNFWTAAVTQRLFDDQLAFGVAHDWLHDDYYNSLHFSQWRLKAAWQMNDEDEFGLWATVADRGANAQLPTIPPTVNRFRPYSQGVGYWQRQWNSAMRTQLYTGPAAQPGEWVFGGSTFAPLNDYWALTTNAHYILPSARGGVPGFTEETWNISLGVQFYPGSALRQGLLGQRALFNVADNSTMAIRRF